MPAKRTPDTRPRSHVGPGAEDPERTQRHHRQGGAAGARRDPGGVRRRPGPCATSSSSASSRAIRRTCRAVPSSGRPASSCRKAMAEAGIDRKQAYLTNAVKHFKFEQRGQRRIHAKPTAGEVKHYRPWLMKELELVRPKLVVALGGDGASGAHRQVDADHALARARPLRPTCEGYVTVHPSYLLRLPDEETKQRGLRGFPDRPAPAIQRPCAATSLGRSGDRRGAAGARRGVKPAWHCRSSRRMTGVTVMPCSTIEITMVSPSVAQNRSGCFERSLAESVGEVIDRPQSPDAEEADHGALVAARSGDRERPIHAAQRTDEEDREQRVSDGLPGQARNRPPPVMAPPRRTSSTIMSRRSSSSAKSCSFW